MFSFEQQLHIVCVVVVTSRGEAAPEHVEREEEAGPGSAEPAAEEWSGELKEEYKIEQSRGNFSTYINSRAVLVFLLVFHVISGL